MTSDPTRLKNSLRRWAHGVTVAAVTRTAQQVSQHDAPRKTGELARSVQTKPVLGGTTQMRTGVRFTTIQAVTTDKGARPHVIRPRTARALVFYWPKAGRTVAFRKVNHPGNAGRRWFQPALKRRWPRALRDAARSRRL
jgi:hypothetical protein